MRVFSAFNGYSGARLALEKTGITVDTYYISEIDKYANAVTMHHYPDSIQLGDIKGIKSLPEIDIMFAGFPCQSFSLAGKQLNFNDEREGNCSLKR